MARSIEILIEIKLNHLKLDVQTFVIFIFMHASIVRCHLIFIDAINCSNRHLVIFKLLPCHLKQPARRGHS